MSKLLLNAARHLAEDRNFSPIYDTNEMFDSPVVLASQRDTFESLHLLSSLANSSDPALISVQRVVDWLGKKSKAATGAR